MGVHVQRCPHYLWRPGPGSGQCAGSSFVRGLVAAAVNEDIRQRFVVVCGSGGGMVVVVAVFALTGGAEVAREGSLR